MPAVNYSKLNCWLLSVYVAPWFSYWGKPRFLCVKCYQNLMSCRKSAML